MNKRILTSLFLAATVLTASLPSNELTVFADGYYEYVDQLAGIKFESFEKMCEFKQTLKGVSSVNDVEDEVSDYLIAADGIYVPNNVSADDIINILVTPTYMQAYIDYDGTKMQFQYYHDAKVGKAQYVEAEEKSLSEIGDIYYYFLLEQSYYVWKQGDNYFMLRIDGNLDDKYISLCSTKKLAFSENSETAELTKIKDKIYYVNPDGSYATGWQTIEGKKYYFRKNGEAITKNCVIGKIRYKFSSDGVCRGKYTGWTKSANGKRYYKNGVMVTNKWLKTKSGQRYYAGADGYIHID